jgi:hypothetical protein
MIASELVNGAVVGGFAAFVVLVPMVLVLRAVMLRSGTSVKATLPTGEVVDAQVVRRLPKWRCEVAVSDGTHYVVKDVRRQSSNVGGRAAQKRGATP